MAPLAPLLAALAAATLVSAQQDQPSAPTAPQRGALLRAAMHTSLDPAGGAVQVRIRYDLRMPAGANDVPVAAVLFASAAIEDASGDGVPFVLDGARRLTGAIPVQRSDTARELSIEVAYRVRLASPPLDEGSSPQRVRVPVLAVLWPPIEATPGRFSAEIELPSRLYARPVFPAAAQAGAAGAARSGLYVTLPVVPALVAFDVGISDDAGFVFWGLFVAFLAIVILYALWMLRIERQ